MGSGEDAARDPDRRLSGAESRGTAAAAGTGAVCRVAHGTRRTAMKTVFDAWQSYLEQVVPPIPYWIATTIRDVMAALEMRP